MTFKSASNFDRFATLTPINVTTLKVTRQKGCLEELSLSDKRDNIIKSIGSLVINRSKLPYKHFYKKELGQQINKLSAEISILNAKLKSANES